jgi:hypothetical protein
LQLLKNSIKKINIILSNILENGGIEVDKTESKVDKNPVLGWIRDNKRPLIFLSTMAGLIILNHYSHKPLKNQRFDEFDLISKRPMDKVNEYREQIRILHSKGVAGMWEKLSWIDKVVRSRPENMSNRNISLNLPPREHGWNLYKKE